MIWYLISLTLLIFSNQRTKVLDVLTNRMTPVISFWIWKSQQNLLKISVLGKMHVS